MHFITKYFCKYSFKILFINLINIYLFIYYLYFISKHIYIYIDLNNIVNYICSIKFFKLLIHIIRLFLKIIYEKNNFVLTIGCIKIYKT